MNAVWPHAPATATPTSAAYLMGRFRSQTGDLPQQLGIVTPVSELRLDVAPAQDALLVDQEIRTIGEEAVFEQYTIGAAHLALEVTEQILLHRVLRLVLLECRHRVHADREHDRAGTLERVVVFTEGAVLGGTRAGEREWEEREQHVLPPPERGQRDVGPRGGWQREIGRHGPDGQGRRGRSRQRQAPGELSTARAIQ